MRGYLAACIELILEEICPEKFIENPEIFPQATYLQKHLLCRISVAMGVPRLLNDKKNM